jgi:hypothetical protein
MDAEQNNPMVIEAIIPCRAEMHDNMLATDQIQNQIKLAQIVTTKNSSFFRVTATASSISIAVTTGPSLPREGDVFDLENGLVEFTKNSVLYRSSSGVLYFYFRSGKPVFEFCDVLFVSDGQAPFHAWGRIIGK